MAVKKASKAVDQKVDKPAKEKKVAKKAKVEEIKPEVANEIKETVVEVKPEAREEVKIEERKEVQGLPSLKEMLEAGVHFGHVVRRSCPKMGKYIFAPRNGVQIFDLFKTRENLNKACLYLEDSIKSGKKVLLVGTKGQVSELVRTEAIRMGVAYITTRWVGGLFTNWEQIKKRVDRLVEMKRKMEAGDYKKYTKKEQVDLKKEIDRLERMYGGLVSLNSLPDIVFIVDPSREMTAVRESLARKVVIVAIADSNCDPTGIAYVVPGNDDAVKSVTLLVGCILAAIERGLKAAKSAAK